MKKRVEAAREPVKPQIHDPQARRYLPPAADFFSLIDDLFEAGLIQLHEDMIA
jgi:hypothetical protein